MRVFALLISVFASLSLLGCRGTTHESTGADLEAAKKSPKKATAAPNVEIFCEGAQLGDDPLTIAISFGMSSDFKAYTFVANSEFGSWTEESANMLTWGINGTKLSFVLNKRGGYDQIAVKDLECSGRVGGGVSTKKYIGGLAGMAPAKSLSDCTCKYRK